jgi:hypothetical protein
MGPDRGDGSSERGRAGAVANAGIHQALTSHLSNQELLLDEQTTGVVGLDDEIRDAVVRGRIGTVDAPEEGWVIMAHCHHGAPVRAGYRNPAVRDVELLALDLQKLDGGGRNRPEEHCAQALDLLAVELTPTTDFARSEISFCAPSQVPSE